MNINDLTIGEAKGLSGMFGNQPQSGSVAASCIGQYVIVRSRNEGINAGYVEAADETGIVLREARRIYYHRPLDKNQSWYEGVANTGLSSESKLSAPVIKKAIIEDYSWTVCTSKGQKSIEEAESHAQS